MEPPRTAGELESFSPIDGRRIGAVPTIAPEQVQSVVDDVAEVQPFWAQLPLNDRARYMRRAAQVIIDNLAELTELLTVEQGKPRNESYVMELLPTIDALHWIAQAGPEILADERIKLPLFVKQKSRPLRLRAARRRGRDRAVELPVVDPVRRGRDRAHVGQRGGAEAGVADAADRRADPVGVRARRPPRGARADRPRRRRRGQRAGRVERGEDLLHRLGRGRPPGSGSRAPSG